MLYAVSSPEPARVEMAKHSQLPGTSHNSDSVASPELENITSPSAVLACNVCSYIYAVSSPEPARVEMAKHSQVPGTSHNSDSVASPELGIGI